MIRCVTIHHVEDAGQEADVVVSKPAPSKLVIWDGYATSLYWRRSVFVDSCLSSSSPTGSPSSSDSGYPKSGLVVSPVFPFVSFFSFFVGC